MPRRWLLHVAWDAAEARARNAAGGRRMVRAQACAAASGHQPTPLWAAFSSPEPPPPKVRTRRKWVHLRRHARTLAPAQTASRRGASRRRPKAAKAMPRGAACSLHRRAWPRCRLRSCGPRSCTPKARPPAPVPHCARPAWRGVPRATRRIASQRWRTTWRGVRRAVCMAAVSRIALCAGLTRSPCVPLSELDWGSQFPTADRLALGSAPSTAPPASLAAATASVSAAFAAAHALYAPPSTVAESRGINPHGPDFRLDFG